MPVVVKRRLAEPPDLLSLQQVNCVRYPCLLSSVNSENPKHQYDILFAGLQPVSLDHLDRLDLSVGAAHDELPFVGGYVAFFPYEYAQDIESKLDLPATRLQAQVWQVSAAFIWNKSTHTLSAVAQPQCADWPEQMWRDWDACVASVGKVAKSLGVCRIQEEAPEKFLQGVAKAKEYILAGDVFQVNLSRQWQAYFDRDLMPYDIFAHLRAHNPAPFSAVVTQSDWGIVSSSPERLVSVRNGVIETRPIAGTRRRGDDALSDDALRHELILHPKEQAEHVMLLDLERNDLGRVCVPGSVVVDELMTVESYAHVHHIVSNVKGILKPGMTAKSVINATFPGGTITGCPKIRCMEIIAELEQEPRGVYTGSLGYISLDGQMDMNILIRSFYWEPHRLTFRAGAGIVFDSEAISELEETRHKAKGLLRALAL